MNHHDLHPCDILGISGGHGAIGLGIALATLSWPFTRPRYWQGLSHVAIVGPYGENDAIWESTTLSPSRCIVCGERHSGVQAHLIDRRIREWHEAGQVIWRYRLRFPLSVTEQYRLGKYLESEHGKSYDYVGAFRARDLLIAWARRALWLREDLRTLYCSEFAPAALREAGRWKWSVSGLSPNRFCRLGVKREVVVYPGVILPDELEESAWVSVSGQNAWPNRTAFRHQSSRQ